MPTFQESVNTKSFLPHNKTKVTFKEVQHLLESQPDYTTSQQSEMLQRVRGNHSGYGIRPIIERKTEPTEEIVVSLTLLVGQERMAEIESHSLIIKRCYTGLCLIQDISTAHMLVPSCILSKRNICS